MSKVVVIGSGPAGISSAIYTARAGLDTTVLEMGPGALEKAHLIENFYGLEKPMSGIELHNHGIKQAEALGVKIIHTQVLAITYEDNFKIKTNDNLYDADAIILATGSQRTVPKIDGIKQFEGAGVSYCAVCDGFFHRGKDVAVLGSGDYALHEASELLPIAKSVTILTNGEELTAEIPDTIKVIPTKIKCLEGDQVLSKVIFEDGTEIVISGLFVAQGVAGSTDFALKLGALVEGNKIVVDGNMATNIPGLYAAGDCTGGMLQVSKAVSDGAHAGTSAVKFLRSKK